MANNTNIEWADSTFNPWIGCTKVSPACDHCYAENLMDKRMHVVQWGQDQPRKRTSAKNWNEPLRWEKENKQFFAEHGRRRRVFCASLADVFDKEVPVEWRRDLFNLILSTPSIDWLLLTKRIGNAARMIDEVIPDNMKSLPADSPIAWPWPNVWIGATICNQAEADRDIPKLLDVPASVRFLSIEPLLGPIDLTSNFTMGNILELDALAGREYHHDDAGQWTETEKVDWVIVGGESGSEARPTHPDWVRILRDQCNAAGVPFLFKQWGEWKHLTPDEQREFQAYEKRKKVAWPDGTVGYGDFRINGGFGKPIFKIGKKTAGRLLDGVTHTEFPKVNHA